MNRADTFTRADSASALGTPSDGGSAWVTAGTWGVSSNRAYNPGANSQSSAVLESNAADVDVQATLAVVVGNAGTLCFRWTDTTNYLILDSSPGGLVLYRQQAGGFSSIGSYSGAVASGDVFRVNLIGSAVRVYQNGVLRIGPVTETFNQTATKHGLRSDSSSASRFAAFSVTDLGLASLAAGAVSLTSAGLTTAALTAAAPTGGTGPYSYQWQRSLTGGGAGFASVSGATSLTLSDTGLTRGTAYFYRCQQTDSAGSPATVTTAEFVALTKTSQLVADGNSQTAGGGGTSWATQILPFLPPVWAISNVAVGGQTTQAMSADAVSQVASLLAAGNARNLGVAQEVMNDIYFNATGAQAYANLVTYCGLVRGVNGSKVLVICPQPDRGDFPGTSTLPGGTGPAQRANYKQRVLDFAALFNANWRTFCDAFYDPAQDARFADVTNATYFAGDLVHWTTTLQAVVATGVSATIPVAFNPGGSVAGASRAIVVGG